MSVKLERLNNIFVIEISKIINEEIRNRDISFVTITSCNITSDLSYAKVYFTTLGDALVVEKALNGAKEFIRNLLMDRVEVRKMPDISFIYDESINYGKKIESIIERINDDGGNNRENN